MPSRLPAPQTVLRSSRRIRAWLSSRRSPSGSPCALAMFAFGVPWAISVRTMISDGCVVSAFAFSIAVAIAAVSSPSATCCTVQPYASKRLPTSSVNARLVLPSIVISFLSYRRISLPKAEVPGERSRFRSDALHQAAVARERVGVVVHDGEAFAVELGSQARLRHRQANRVCDALPQRSCRRLYADGMPNSGCPGVLLPHWRKFFSSSIEQPVAKQVQQRIFQHGRMSRGEHKTVSARPLPHPWDRASSASRASAP